MSIILKKGLIVTGEKEFIGDILIENGKIVEIEENISKSAEREINCEGKYIFAGMIDTHVHFRQPGLTHKGDIVSETTAAVFGGVTTVFDMPNTIPNTTSILEVRKKQGLYQRASKTNFGIYLGASNENIEELKKVDRDKTIPAIKIFMAESTGEMTVFDESILENIFANTSKLLAIHSEDEKRRLTRISAYKSGTLYEAKSLNSDNPILHSIIRDNEMARIATQKVLELSKKFNHRAHILHVSTKEELPIIKEGIELGLISAETCPHYLIFNTDDIAEKRNYLVMNPSLKSKEDSLALLEGIKSGIISQIVTDHAPHLESEKELPYGNAPAGVPGVQFALPLILKIAKDNNISLSKVASLISENASTNYKIREKGFLKTGFVADICIIDPKKTMKINKSVIKSKCGWSPYEGVNLDAGNVYMTIVNGYIIVEDEKLVSEKTGKSTLFEI